MADILTAFRRIAFAFDPFEHPEEVGLNSTLLNHAIFSLPRLRGLITKWIDEVDLKMARSGNKEELWVDDDKYPDVKDAKDVRRLQ